MLASRPVLDSDWPPSLSPEWCRFLLPDSCLLLLEGLLAGADSLITVTRKQDELMAKGYSMSKHTPVCNRPLRDIVPYFLNQTSGHMIQKKKIVFLFWV